MLLRSGRSIWRNIQLAQAGTVLLAAPHLNDEPSNIPDVQADQEYTFGAKNVEKVRTVLAVPILKGEDLLGVVVIYHLEVRPFTDKQIALVETFADQAAIAIENVRLLDELRQSLQQQTT